MSQFFGEKILIKNRNGHFKNKRLKRQTIKLKKKKQEIRVDIKFGVFLPNNNSSLNGLLKSVLHQRPLNTSQLNSKMMEETGFSEKKLLMKEKFGASRKSYGTIVTSGASGSSRLSPSISYIRHDLQPDDTIAGIALKYGVTVSVWFS